MRAADQAAREYAIRTTARTLERITHSRLSTVSVEVYKRASDRVLKRSRKRTIRYSILAANVLLLIAVIVFVVKTSGSTQVARQSAVNTNASSVVASPLDQLSSADIAVTVARAANLYEATSVTNNADSINAQLALSSSGASLATKPQVVNTSLKSINDLQKYTTQPGDTVGSLAAKFGITSETIRLSNGLTGNNLNPGVQLLMSPVNGIVYLVKAGDTVDSIVGKYRVNKEQVIAFNDLETESLAVGEYIVLPEAQQIITTRTSSVLAPTLFAFGGGSYDRGWCTWYAAAKSGAPGGWGNANTWHIYAPSSGWTVSTVPRVGAIAQTSVGWAGHVGIVEAVSADGTMIKYSDMNGLAGFNRVGNSDWVPTLGKYQRFIYH